MNFHSIFKSLDLNLKLEGSKAFDIYSNLVNIDTPPSPTSSLKEINKKPKIFKCFLIFKPENYIDFINFLENSILFNNDNSDQIVQYYNIFKMKIKRDFNNINVHWFAISRKLTIKQKPLSDDPFEDSHRPSFQIFLLRTLKSSNIRPFKLVPGHIVTELTEEHYLKDLCCNSIKDLLDFSSKFFARNQFEFLTKSSEKRIENNEIETIENKFNGTITIIYSKNLNFILGAHLQFFPNANIVNYGRFTGTFNDDVWSFAFYQYSNRNDQNHFADIEFQTFVITITPSFNIRSKEHLIEFLIHTVLRHCALDSR